MTRVLYTPPPQPRAPRWRPMVGFRLASLYPEGTLIEDSAGTVWRSWRDHEFDSLPAWEEVTRPSEPPVNNQKVAHPAKS